MRQTLTSLHTTLPHKEAFDFLETLNPKFDLTSIDPISEAPKTITKHILLNYSQDKKNKQNDPKTLEECANFFQRFGIKCKKENIALNDNILSGIPQVYKLLKTKIILVPTPTFGPYLQQLQLENIPFVAIPTKASEGFLPNPNDLRKAAKEYGATVLLLCYPNNPTGTVLTEESAKQIAEVAKECGLFVISDEAFLGNYLKSRINEEPSLAKYSQQQSSHFSIVRVPGMLDRSITFTSPAKMMGIPLLRTSFCVGPSSLVQKLFRVGGFDLAPALVAAIQDNEENNEYLASNREKYSNNIKTIQHEISRLNQKFCEVFGEEKSYVRPYITAPDTAGMYILNFSGLYGKTYEGREISSSLDVAKFLSAEASVGVVPGECCMFEPEEMLIQISTGHKPLFLTEAFENIIDAADKIQNTPAKTISPIKANILQETQILRSKL